MALVTVRDVRKFPVTSGPRLGQLDTLVTYQTEGGQFFMVTVPKENPTEADVQKAIQEDMAARSKLVGRTFTA